MKHNGKRHARWLIPLLVVVLALLVVGVLMLTRETPEAVEDDVREPRVETVTVQRDRHRQDIHVQGTVTAARRVSLQPQVAGRLVWIHPDLEPGGRVKANEPLFRIQVDDFEFAVEQQQSMLAEAEAQLRLERGRIQVAEREWELFQEELEQDEPPELALREPQLAAAQAQLAAARAGLEQARLDLSRTEVRAPFDALVEREQAALGQLVSTQAEVASLVASNHFWLRAAVAQERIPDIAIPGVNARTGAAVEIRHRLGDLVIRRRGEVVRLLGDVSPEGRMARVLIRVDDPLGLDGQPGNQGNEDGPPGSGPGPPLLLDAFVDARIQGAVVEDLIELPRRALREGERAYVVTADATLSIRELDIAWARPDTVLVREGLEDGDRVITSPLAMAHEGMPVVVGGDD